jgi:membrane-associated phospholipid phosphatase
LRVDDARRPLGVPPPGGLKRDFVERFAFGRSGYPSAMAIRYRAAFTTAALGYAICTIVFLGIGLLLVHVLDGSLGQWDQRVNEYLARGRSAGVNDVTTVATSSLNTLPVVIAAAVVAGFLALRRRFREAAFLACALLIEVAVFLSVAFVVARPRPEVVRLNSSPPTSSFPSGHTAAATVLFVGIALVVISSTRSSAVKVLSVVVAFALALSVGYSRVYRGLHHPTDVFFGIALGLACLAVSALVVRTAGSPSHAQE